MSWSVDYIGKAGAVAYKLDDDLSKIKCAQPEEDIKSKVGTVLLIALAAMPPGTVIKVKAAGSQHAPDGSKPHEVLNSLNVEVSYVYGFIE